MWSFQKIEQLLSKHKNELKEKFKVKEIGIFGSYVRGEQKKRSDVDILVEIEPEYQTFRNYIGLKFWLEEILDSKIDLVLKDTIKEQLKANILKEVINV